VVFGYVGIDSTRLDSTRLDSLSMGLSTAAIAILAAYALAMALTFYWCVVADPNKSPAAKFVTQTLPTHGLRMVGNIVGKRGLLLLETVMERILGLIYLTVVVGCYVTLVFVSYPKARESTHVDDYHLINGHVTFAVAIASWLVTMTASPGIITQENLHFYDHFPYDDLLYVEGRSDKLRGIPRLPRSKFDRLKYRQHVARFDHYCGWVGSTIGEENYRLFLFFVATQFVMCVYATTIIAIFLRGEIQNHNLWEVTLFDRITGAEYKVNRWIVLQFLLDRHVCEAIVFVIVVAMSALLAYFLGYHFYITSKGMTTNEHYKWGTSVLLPGQYWPCLFILLNRQRAAWTTNPIVVTE
jgi:DHHC palmitoyltransferase